MSIAVRRQTTLAEFLDWEERQPLRYEFDGTLPIAMNGGTAAHAIIQSDLHVVMRGRLRSQACRFVGNDLKIEVAGRIRYPDGFVMCSPLLPGDKVVRDPVVIFEVLSDSTSSTDYITKNQEYAATPSVLRYVILSQNQIGGTMFERQNGDWVGHMLSRDAILRMPEIGVEVPLPSFTMMSSFRLSQMMRYNRRLWKENVAPASTRADVFKDWDACITIDPRRIATLGGLIRRLSDEHDLTLYNAAYLDLAIRRRLPFASREAASIRSGIKTGIDMICM